MTSLQTTIVLLSLMMVLVVACTLAQTKLGTFGAVGAYMRSPFVYWRPEGASYKIPIFPGGGLVGLLLLINLAAAQFLRLEVSWRKAGLWVVHLGLIMLFAGEFVTGFFQRESQMILPVGGTRGWMQDLHETELALIDGTDKDFDAVFAISEKRLARGGAIADARLPFVLKIGSYESIPAPVGADADSDDIRVMVSLEKDGRTFGPWTLDSNTGQVATFTDAGRGYAIELRPKRHYLPFALTLKKFIHETYPGTDIPKGFASRVRVFDAAGNTDREVLISMNNPLRYDGLSFYQASFAKEDTVSILQIVANPGRLIPYLACALVAAGLLLHFAMRFRPSGASR